MTRGAREIGDSEFYHVLITGNDKTNIFFDDEDKSKILGIMTRYSDITALLAYCVLKDHAHFLIKIKKNNISTLMKRVNVSYAFYYNFKYDRKGHVFYDRFKSSCIGDNSVLLAVMRYIHNDPINCGYPSLTYKWSSYNEYISQSSFHYIADIYFLLTKFGDTYDEAVTNFIAYNYEDNNDIFLDVEESMHNKINNMIKKYLKNNDIELCDLGYKHNIQHRVELVLMARKRGKLSIRKIGEMLELNRGIVYSIIKKYTEE